MKLNTSFTTQELGRIYEDVVGYDLFAEDRITICEALKIMYEYDDESELNGGNRVFENKKVYETK